MPLLVALAAAVALVGVRVARWLASVLRTTRLRGLAVPAVLLRAWVRRGRAAVVVGAASACTQKLHVSELRFTPHAGAKLRKEHLRLTTACCAYQYVPLPSCALEFW